MSLKECDLDLHGRGLRVILVLRARYVTLCSSVAAVAGSVVMRGVLLLPLSAGWLGSEEEEEEVVGTLSRGGGQTGRACRVRDRCLRLNWWNFNFIVGVDGLLSLRGGGGLHTPSPSLPSSPPTTVPDGIPVPLSSAAASANKACTLGLNGGERDDSALVPSELDLNLPPLEWGRL